MFIQTEAPFQITPEQDCTHAIKDSIQITVTNDVGENTVNHRVGQKPSTGEAERWLHVDLKDKGLHVFVSGTHVVVTAKDRLPTFDLQTPETLMKAAMQAMKADKDDKGRYVVDTAFNRAILTQLFGRVTVAEKNRLFAWVRHAIARLAE